MGRAERDSSAIRLVILAGLSGKRVLMKRDEALRKRKEAEADLRAQGVAHAALFGSVARGENRPDSDIDILVEIAPEIRMGLFQYVGIVQYIDGLFPDPVDVANREGLKPLIRPSVERDAIYAF
jgi:predicted nucleotidyltransferase